MEIFRKMKTKKIMWWYSTKDKESCNNCNSEPKEMMILATKIQLHAELQKLTLMYWSSSGTPIFVKKSASLYKIWIQILRHLTALKTLTSTKLATSTQPYRCSNNCLMLNLKLDSPFFTTSSRSILTKTINLQKIISKLW